MKISEIGTVVTGKTPSTKNPAYFDGEVPFVTPEDISDAYVVKNTKRHISESGYDAIKNNTISGTSVLVGCIGSDMGNVSLMFGKGATNQQINSITKINDTINPYYVYYYLSTKKEYLRRLAGSTTTPILSKGNFEDIDIPVPEKAMQDSISSVLMSIDNMIEENKEINILLEKLCDTLYNYWFLQFDFPDEYGKPYKSNSGRMVYSDELKREIPEGWKVEPLNDNSISKPIKNGIEQYNGEKNYLATANIVNEQITDGEWVKYANRESRANMAPAQNSIWFAKMKSSVKHLTLPQDANQFINKYILSTGFYGIKVEPHALAYLHCLYSSPWFELKKDTLAHGATQQAVNDSDLGKIRIVIPPTDVLMKFSEIADPILQLKYENMMENKRLIELRDFLLPLLMSGQVIVKE